MDNKFFIYIYENIYICSYIWLFGGSGGGGGGVSGGGGGGGG